MTDFNKGMRNAAIGNLGEWTTVVNEIDSLLHKRAQEISDKRGDVSNDDAVRMIARQVRMHFALDNFPVR